MLGRFVVVCDPLVNKGKAACLVTADDFVSWKVWQWCLFTLSVVLQENRRSKERSCNDDSMSKPKGAAIHSRFLWLIFDGMDKVGCGTRSTVPSVALLWTIDIVNSGVSKVLSIPITGWP